MEKIKTTPLWVDWFIARQLSDAVRKGGINYSKTHSVANENPLVKTIAWGKGGDDDRIMTYLNNTGGVTAARIIAQKWDGSKWKNSIVITVSFPPPGQIQLVEVAKSGTVDIYQFKSILLGRRIKRLLGVLLTHPEFQVKEVK